MSEKFKEIYQAIYDLEDKVNELALHEAAATVGANIPPDPPYSTENYKKDPRYIDGRFMGEFFSLGTGPSEQMSMNLVKLLGSNPSAPFNMVELLRMLLWLANAVLIDREFVFAKLARLQRRVIQLGGLEEFQAD